MAAALTLAILLTVSLFVVRIASVALRLTGLSDDVARFQSLSAFTGTGFTTHEAEMIVNYPLRRKILSGLMVFGNLGLVSVAATFIVTFVGFDQSQSSISVQVMLIVAAIAFIIVMATNSVIDRVLCAFIGQVLKATTSLGERRYEVKLEVDEDVFIAEHVVTGDAAISPSEIPSIGEGLLLLGARTGKWRDFSRARDADPLEPGSVLICYGGKQAHDELETQLQEREMVSSR